LLDLLKTPAGADFLREEYVNKGRSANEIAESLGTYPNRVRRAMRFHGIAVRPRGEAQAAALRNGRAAHPTRGKPRPPEVRQAVSAGVARAWSSMGDEERAARSLLTKSQWEARTRAESEEIRRRASAGLRRAAVKGSRLEQHLLLGLRLAGHRVDFHAECVVAAERMHVDLLLRKAKVALEVDGPTHYRPVFSEEQLARNAEADRRKDGLLQQAGYKVIRVRQTSKNLSAHRMNLALKSVVEALSDPGSLPAFLQLEV
jgi:very-short-patch-repair endonuclease